MLLYIICFVWIALCCFDSHLGRLVGDNTFLRGHLGTIPVAFLGLYEWGLNSQFLWFMSSYLLIQVLDGNVLVPFLFSTRNNLHPAVIIIAILFFGGIWGFWGLFFAIPLATFIKAIANSWPEPKGINSSMND